MKQNNGIDHTTGNHQFLAGGGEMGELMRLKDWSASPVGTPDTWPQSLRTTLSIILNSKFPMFLFWGPQLICFYNDAYRPSLGNAGKHPGILGSRAEDYWQEIWPVIKPLIDQVLAGGDATWSEDQLIPIFRNGKMEDVYWTFSYSPVNDESGKPAGVFVTCVETTDKIHTLSKLEAERQKIEEADKRFRNIVKQAPVGITILRGRNFMVEMANDNYLQIVDKKEADFVGKPLFDSLPEVEETVSKLLHEVLDTGIPFNGIEYPVPVNRYGKHEVSYFNFLYHPLYENDGHISGIIVTVTDVTESVKTKHYISESEKQFRKMVMDSPIPMTIFRGSDYVIEIANITMFRDIWRKNKEEVLGKKLLDVFPELENQKYPELLRNVFEGGKLYKETESLVYVQGDDGLKSFYLDYEYAPLFEPDGAVTGILVTVNDVTEKVEARLKLQESEKKSNIVIEASELGTWELNLRTKEVSYSDRYLEILGFEKGAALSHEQLLERLHPDDMPIRENAFSEAFATGILHYQSRLIWPDGSLHWMEGRGKVFYDETGQPEKMLGTLRDITESQLREETLARMAAIVQSSSDAIISKDLNGIIATWNTGAELIFGYTEAEMIGQPISKLIPADRRDEEISILQKLKSGERVDHFETKRITKHNKLLDVSLTISPIKNMHGNIIGASKIARNITSQKEAERLIAANEQKFRLLADSMPQFIWTSDVHGKLNYFNQAVYNYAGLTAQQMGNEGWLQIVHPDDREANIAAWTHAIQTGSDFIFEHRFGRSDGEYRWQLSRAIPQKDSAGIIQMWVGTSTDIQEIKEQDQQKDLFISMASHELKTPITSIKGYVQLLQSAYGKTDDEFLKKSLTVIERQVAMLTGLIADLLDVSKIKSGSLVLNKQQFELTEMLQEVISHIQQINPDYTISFLPEKVTVYADRERISQVLINFLTNAVKYSPNSKKIIVKDVTEADHVTVSVQDTGIGINKADQEKIFERFYRVEGKDERTYPGFGIGLFISSEIVKRHQGTIGVHSEPGKGSEFYFSIPLQH